MNTRLEPDGIDFIAEGSRRVGKEVLLCAVRGTPTTRSCGDRGHGVRCFVRAERRMERAPLPTYGTEYPRLVQRDILDAIAHEVKP
jgi:hypothetical protein